MCKSFKLKNWTNDVLPKSSLEICKQEAGNRGLVVLFMAKECVSVNSSSSDQKNFKIRFFFQY